ncbi:MAG: putative Ig domain-containing protein, partial [Verrucomicrobiota bacterium]|nr:putative Ig domain-containing protein [Verrucomicrobiota bacterium]
MTSLTANAAPPEINSPLTASATIGQAFSYTITTASNDATGYGTSNNLPDGITRSGAILSGVPTEAGIFNVALYASNADGLDSETLVLTVSNAVPVITSSLEASGRVGQSFSYTISASNSPDSYSMNDLSAIGLTLDTATGIISGIPTSDIDIDLIVSATNSAGTGQANVVLSILPALSAPSQPTVEIVSPSAGTTIEGTTSQLRVEAKVTPVLGETTDVVFLRWNNPSAPLTEVILTEMSLTSTSAAGVETYAADVDIGFNPNDRQLGGGSIQLQVVAYQTNAQSSADAGTSDVTFTVKPILEYLFPVEEYAMDAIEVGDVFASVRMDTNIFASVTARIAGVSVVEIPPATTIQSSNGVYNFSSTKRIDFPGFYDIRITGLDTAGNATIIERRIQISDTFAEPVAVVTAPTPGFTNEVFSAAVLRFTQTSREAVTVNNVGVVG